MCINSISTQNSFYLVGAHTRFSIGTAINFLVHVCFLYEKQNNVCGYNIHENEHM